jgi:hypothetical protein
MVVEIKSTSNIKRWMIDVPARLKFLRRLRLVGSASEAKELPRPKSQYGGIMYPLGYQ